MILLVLKLWKKEKLKFSHPEAVSQRKEKNEKENIKSKQNWINTAELITELNTAKNTTKHTTVVHMIRTRVCSMHCMLHAVPVWMPNGSKFSMLQTVTQLSATSRTTSYSTSFQPSKDFSTRIWLLIARACKENRIYQFKCQMILDTVNRDCILVNLFSNNSEPMISHAQFLHWNNTGY